MVSYSILAKYYDRLMGDFDYDGYLSFVKGRLSGEGADLACGSGEITVRLAKEGRKMIGIDISPDMLNVATVKAKNMGLDIKWICQDMLEFELNHKADFITCVCDGVNYVPTQDFKKLLDRVKSNLKENGIFVFDVSSEYKLKNILGDNLFCEDYDDVTYIWQNTLGKGYVDMDIDFFERIKDDTYKRIEESHRQYVYKREFIEDLLKDGWDHEVYDGEKFSTPSSRSKRLLYVCKAK